MYEGRFESFFKASPYGSLLLGGFVLGPLEETSGKFDDDGCLLSPPKNKLPKPKYESPLPTFDLPKVTLATFFPTL